MSGINYGFCRKQRWNKIIIFSDQENPFVRVLVCANYKVRSECSVHHLLFTSLKASVSKCVRKVNAFFSMHAPREGRKETIPIPNNLGVCNIGFV